MPIGFGGVDRTSKARRTLGAIFGGILGLSFSMGLLILVLVALAWDFDENRAPSPGWESLAWLGFSLIAWPLAVAVALLARAALRSLRR